LFSIDYTSVHKKQDMAFTTYFAKLILNYSTSFSFPPISAACFCQKTKGGAHYKMCAA